RRIDTKLDRGDLLPGPILVQVDEVVGERALVGFPGAQREREDLVSFGFARVDDDVELGGLLLDDRGSKRLRDDRLAADRGGVAGIGSGRRRAPGGAVLRPPELLDAKLADRESDRLAREVRSDAASARIADEHAVSSEILLEREDAALVPWSAIARIRESHLERRAPVELLPILPRCRDGAERLRMRLAVATGREVGL